MSFQHDCLDDHEAQRALSRELREIDQNYDDRDTSPAWLQVIRREMAGAPMLVLTVAVFAAALGLSFYFIMAPDTPAILLGPLGLAFVLALVWIVFFLRARFRAEERAAARSDVKLIYAPATTDELEVLHKICETHADVRAAVAQWLADKKTIRQRDMRAARVYALKADRKVAHDDVLRKLSGTDDARLGQSAE
ncbi:hypothetical protein [Rhodanobacter sp. FW106-PBR-R2A-1-13]|uniref:hypothetical protein n=1 Tax=Rhodanobacter sp. FW106-PBR-R2A-1-13 TaxID=3454845 RepID=UPI0034E403E6